MHVFDSEKKPCTSFIEHLQVSRALKAVEGAEVTSKLQLHAGMEVLKLRGKFEEQQDPQPLISKYWKDASMMSSNNGRSLKSASSALP